jgi:hypothetical protein
MRIPVALPVVHVRADEEGRISIDLDGEPYGADRALCRGHLPQVLDELINERGTAVRVEVAEADGTTYADIVTPAEGDAQVEPDLRPMGPPGLSGDGFRPGEQVAMAYVLTYETADETGTATLRLPPALLAGKQPTLMLVGLTSSMVVSVEAPA